MNRFKKIMPPDSLRRRVSENVPQNKSGYIDSLANLGKKSEKGRAVLRAISGIAASILIVTVVTVWALIGRGIRGTEPILPSGDNVTDVKNDYYVIFDYTDGIVEGQSDLQQFFDDYITGKACKLDIFRVNSKENGKYVGTSAIFDMTEKGDGLFYCMSANDKEYTAYENAQYYAENFINSVAEPLYITDITFVITEGFDRISYTSHNSPEEILLDLSAIQNSYENSDRVYDYRKAEAVVVQDGQVKENGHLLNKFIERHLKGKAAFIRITGDNDIEISNATNGTYSSYINGEKISSYDFGIKKVTGMTFIPDTVQTAPSEEEIADIEPLYVTGLYLKTIKDTESYKRDTLDLFQIPFEEDMYFSSTVIETGIGEYLYGSLGYADMIKKTEELIKLIKADITPLSQTKTYLSQNTAYCKLGFKSGAELYVYKNGDGTLSDTAGVRYPDDSNNVLAYKISAALLSELESVTLKADF